MEALSVCDPNGQEKFSAVKFLLPLSLASFLGIISPLCMYGTVPIIAALGRKNSVVDIANGNAAGNADALSGQTDKPGNLTRSGAPQHLLAAFMVSSILLNPNIFFLSFALGFELALTRLMLSFLSGILAGVLVWFFYKKKELFSFERFAPGPEKSKKSFFSDLFKAFRITSVYLLIGLTLTAVFDRYIPPEWISGMFGAKRGLGVLFAASLSVPLYACGGGTIPLINAWLRAGMGAGDAIAFMLAGPAVKINNLSAVKIILGAKNFFIYIVYSLMFAILSGLIINGILFIQR